MTLEQLKALAYDTMVSIEQGQRNLRAINEAIQKKAQEKKKEK